MTSTRGLALTSTRGSSRSKDKAEPLILGFNSARATQNLKSRACLFRIYPSFQPASCSAKRLAAERSKGAPPNARQSLPQTAKAVWTLRSRFLFSSA